MDTQNTRPKLTNLIRIDADSEKPDAPINALTGRFLRITQFDCAEIELTLMRNGRVADLDGLASICLEILDVGARNSPEPRSAKLLLSKIVPAETVAASLTDEEHDCGGCHARIALSGSETAFPQGEKFLRITAYSAAGERSTFIQGFFDAYARYCTDSPQEPRQEPPFGLAEAEILFARRSANLIDLSDISAARENIGVCSKDYVDSAMSSHLHAQYIERDEVSGNYAPLSVLGGVSENLLTARNEISSLSTGVSAISENVSALSANLEATRENVSSISEGFSEMSANLALAAQNIDAERNAAASRANSAGVRLFGATLTANPVRMEEFSLCVRFSKDASGVLASFGNLTITAVAGALEISGCGSVSAAAGLNHCLVAVWVSGTLKIYIDASPAVVYAFAFSRGSSNAVFGNSAFTGRIGGVKIFNFDMGAENAPYTVADYAAGIDEDARLRSGSKIYKSDETIFPAGVSGEYDKWISASSYYSVSYVNGRLSSSISANGNFVEEVRMRLSSPIRKGSIIDVEIGAGSYSRSTNYNLNFGVVYGAYTNALEMVARSTNAGTGVLPSLAVRFVAASDIYVLSVYLPRFDRLAGETVAYGTVKIKVNGAALSLDDTADFFQLKDLSANRTHGALSGTFLPQAVRNPSNASGKYAWGSGVSAGAYIIGEDNLLPPESEIEIIAKADAAATLSMGSSAGLPAQFASGCAVSAARAQIAKFYTGASFSKLFVTPSAAGITLEYNIRITRLN